MPAADCHGHSLEVEDFFRGTLDAIKVKALSYSQVILYDKDSPAMNVLPRWQKILWDMSLLSSPFLVLIFHVGFWRKVCFVYKSIDTSKELIKGRDIWSAKV